MRIQIQCIINTYNTYAYMKCRPYVFYKIYNAVLNSKLLAKQTLSWMYTGNTLLKSDVTRHDHVSVVMDAGSRIVNFIRDGTVFA